LEKGQERTFIGHEKNLNNMAKRSNSKKKQTIRDRAFLIEQWALNARLRVHKMERLNRILAYIILVNVLTFAVLFYIVHWGTKTEFDLFTNNAFNYLGIEAPLVMMCIVSILAPILLYFIYLGHVSSYRRSIFEIVKLGSKKDASPVVCLMPLWRILFEHDDSVPSKWGKYYLAIFYLMPSMFSVLIILLLYYYGPLEKTIIISSISIFIMIIELRFFLKWVFVIIMHKHMAALEADENRYVAFEDTPSGGPSKGQYTKIYRRYDADETKRKGSEVKIDRRY